MDKLIAIVKTAVTQDKEIRPPCKCMCCGDSGLVESSFLSRFVEGNNATKFICKRDCEAGTKFRNAYKLSDTERKAFAEKHGGNAIPARVYQSQFDYRLTTEMCEEIHNWEIDEWVKSVQKNQKAIAGETIAASKKYADCSKSTLSENNANTNRAIANV